jgi:hypothetical protein
MKNRVASGSHQPGPSERLGRYVSAMPDVVTSAMFLSVWIAPFALGPKAVGDAMLVMLVEFVLIHGCGMFGAVVTDTDMKRRQRLMTLVALALAYLVFIFLFSVLFDAWWPYLVFSWLVLGKVAAVFRPGVTQEQAHRQQTLAWVESAVAYLGLVFLTLFVPLPRLGMTLDVQPQFGLDGSGVWIDEPHRVIAFGVLYFGVLAWSKAR